MGWEAGARRVLMLMGADRGPSAVTLSEHLLPGVNKLRQAQGHVWPRGMPPPQYSNCLNPALSPA